MKSHFAVRTDTLMTAALPVTSTWGTESSPSADVPGEVFGEWRPRPVSRPGGR